MIFLHFLSMHSLNLLFVHLSMEDYWCTQSFLHQVKMKWLGPNYFHPFMRGNDINKSNVPNMRVCFRHLVFIKVRIRLFVREFLILFSIFLRKGLGSTFALPIIKMSPSFPSTFLLQTSLYSFFLFPLFM